MKYSRRSPTGSSGIDGVMVLYLLLAANIVVALLGPMPNWMLCQSLGLSAQKIKSLDLWVFLTYMFIHGGWLHLMLNMWGLYLFGSVIAAELGGNRFLTLYFLSGISGAVLWLGFNFSTVNYIIGASGAVFGIMMAAAMLVPDMQIMLLFPPIPMKMKTLVVVYALIEIISGTSGDGVAHLAHVGGLIGGYLYMRILYRDQVWDPLAFLWSRKGLLKSGSSKPPGWSIKSYSDNEPTTVSSSELDRILDKISTQGINSLSNEEMATLRRAREEMKKK